MTAYRGKHSRTKPEVSSTAEKPATSRLHMSEKPTDGQQQSGRSDRWHRSHGTSRSAARSASPHAFKHHDAVLETGRARHSKRKTLLIIIPLIIVLVAAAIGIIYAVTHLPAQEGGAQPGIAVTVTIPEGASTNEIANILKNADVISDTQAFIKDVQNMSAEQSLKPGTYELETLMDTNTLINMLVAGPVVNGNALTVPEGLTVEQTAEAVEAACGIPTSDFLAKAYAASEYVADYPFLEGVYNNSMEGFLYPKTYNIPTGSSADYVIRVLLDQFAIETSDLDLTYAEEHGMNLYDIVTMASLIERETAVSEERPLIASVIYNRLRDGMRLQIDATVIYALGPDFTGTEVSYQDLEVDSPYNTYKVDQLPAGPICSPSIESIEAAAHPSETDYYYYVLTSKEGYHTFCVTSEEFEEAKAVYNSVFGIE